MVRSARFIRVSVDDGKTKNSNKYYKMDELSDGSVDCKWGRVGGSETHRVYESGSWDKVYNDRIKHGYTEVTHLHSEDAPLSVQKTNGFLESGNSPEERFLDMLAKYAKKSVQSNYIVSSDAVTQAMVDEAQRILSEITGTFGKKKLPDPKKVNEDLIRLFTVIPRKMRDVHDFLLEPGYDMPRVQQLLSYEQDVLDTMAGQVTMGQTTKTAVVGSSIASMMGIAIAEVTDSGIITKIKGMMGRDYQHRFKKAYQVSNIKTEKKMNDFLPKLHANKSELFWHGSRNENWFNILQTGLLLRPNCNVIRCGAMFGPGHYFASRYAKSENYTSLNGSYWANGRDNTAFISLFEVQVGKQKHVYHADSSLNFDSVHREGCDSVFAHGGADLRNDEFITYHDSQNTVRFVLQIS